MKSRFFLMASALLTASVVATTAAPLFAQTPSESTPSAANLPSTITLDDAIHRAIAENYSVRNAANLARKSDLEVTRNSDNAWLPTVNAGASWQYNYSLEPISSRTLSILQSTQAYVRTTGGDSILVNGVAPNAPIDHVITPAGSHSLKYDASISYNLFRGGSDAASINAAESSSGAAQNTLAWTRQQIALTVTTDYLNVLRNGELVIAADSTLADGQAQLGLVRGQYQAGVVPIGNMYQQQAVLDQDSLALIQAQNNYLNAQAQLLLDINVPPNQYQNYSFNIDGIDTSTSPQARARVNNIISNIHLDSIIDHRPDILAQQQTVQSEYYTIDATRGALLPSLDASAGIGGGGGNPDLGGIKMNNGLNVGLSLSIPIFDAMQSRLSAEEEEVTAENSRVALEQGVQQIRSDATQYINNLKSAELALDATQSALTAANESLRLATESLRVGSGTEVNAIVAQATAESARANWVNAKYSWVLAQKQLAYTLNQWNY